MIRVLITDDQELVRAGLSLLATHDGDIDVVGEAGNGMETINLARRLQPDVILMDLAMPLLDGVTATEQITRAEELASIRVLVLTTFDDEQDVLAAIRAGASGYLLKDIDGPSLRQAIRDVASGDSIADPALAAILFRQAARSASRPELLHPISAREKEVLSLVGQGFNNAEIASRLIISPETARTYVSRLRTKLDARDRTQLAVIAYESGLITPGQRTTPYRHQQT